MPAFNVGKYISNTIASVLEQKYENWELIIVDDCSTDNTRDVIKRFAKKDDRIVFIFSNENSGAGISRNMGIEIANGRFLAFLDADDMWLTNKLSRQVEFMLENNSPISHTSYNYVDGKGCKVSGGVIVSPIVGLLGNLKNTEIGTSTAVIDRYLVKGSIKFEALRARQDLLLWIDLLGRGYYSHGLPSALVNYRIRAGSVSSNKVKMLLVTFKVYMGIKSLSIPERLTCYISYVFNAVKKRTNV